MVIAVILNSLGCAFDCVYLEFWGAEADVLGDVVVVAVWSDEGFLPLPLCGFVLFQDYLKVMC